MKTQSSILKVLVAVAVISAVFAVGRTTGTLNVSVAPEEKSFAGERAGLQEFIDGIKAGDQTSIWKSKVIPPLANQVLLYRNTSGRDVIADYGSVLVKTGETASSTTSVSLFATTSSSVGTWADFGTLNEGKRGLIRAATIATSTTASTTSSVYAMSTGQGNGAIVIPNNSYLFGYIQQNTTLASIGCAAAGGCETATSSNRGFNPIFNVQLHY